MTWQCDATTNVTCTNITVPVISIMTRLAKREPTGVTVGDAFQLCDVVDLIPDDNPILQHTNKLHP